MANSNQNPPTDSKPQKAKPQKTDSKPKRQIPPAILKKYPDLQTLIDTTESMTEEERNYWYQILPIMTDEQIQKLLGILTHEKEQLSKLDAEYEAELEKLNEKHLLEWKEHEAREKREKLHAAEHQANAEEKNTEEALLAQLNNLDSDNNDRNSNIPTNA
ncbi:MAG: hypothetical protein UT36_C0010G0038 [Candidatus Peregrinibacteria bacterium GW2011_GWF2_39_17]|nr:MAG: hypothetical protein UT36_C0010G0038 [Candidatus Peregrinibacteria bacterium GW2011_GWF2_39_17]HCW32284.1 hypothetical protein [Candidatus Peregrinibacteria bacterium]